ncbi:cation diffusion facilitator family transporter [Owenweeksia hongkongensis DSM 17368]|uniref:Cation diffusion facilitator family transporter n=1 Tax=Owenweeksia hongkongensis (strain DSM 17368 / CIP 108786 / JCM 12287 / NRRL B-23963 / UST20020801) TaxID=926562 RepID=G8R1V6_OWEHD|nr:cation diffusion facilitator family transporter [Owenweeksia hongkongensis]AEV33906.1 cation diffusion facilitator family transporter [Owenweeksia hongkongensis DSM 17368]
MAHHHDHGTKNLGLAFFLNLTFTIVEIIGGLLTNSVAILSDALHDLGDSLSLGISWYLGKKSGKAANHKFTFGYQRLSLLGALINSIVLIVGSVFVVIEAIKRLAEPQMPDAQGMLYFAIAGVAVNGFAAYKVSSGKSLNEKVISWHLLEDVLGWAAVLVVSIILMFWDVPWLDPALSIAITIFILYNVVKRLRETLFVFLQGKPEGVDLDEIEKKILATPHVASMHHTHLWSLDGEHHVFTTHLKLKNISQLKDIKQLKMDIKEMLKSEYDFSHYTIETELEDEDCNM